MPGTPLVPLPERPFSPSPPRDNRHSASRPPSLLFGGPPVGTVAHSSSMNLSGLPTTPTPRTAFIPRSPSHDGTLEDLGQEPPGSHPRRRHGSEPTVQTPVMGDTETAQGHFSRGRPVYASSSRSRSNSASTTSSASPPLGATSLLAAIVDATEPSPGTRVHERIRTASDSTTPQTPRPRIDAPGSPKSYHSDLSQASSGSNLPASKSFPRLHQPTVIRRTSGPGFAFLPSPVQASPTTSSFVQHRPRQRTSSIGKQSDRSRTASVRSLEYLQHHMTRRASLSERDHHPGEESRFDQPNFVNSAKVSNDLAEDTGAPTSSADVQSNIPLPPSPESADSLHEIEDISDPPAVCTEQSSNTPFEPSSDPARPAESVPDAAPQSSSSKVSGSPDTTLDSEVQDEVILNEVSANAQDPTPVDAEPKEADIPAPNMLPEHHPDIPGHPLPYRARHGSKVFTASASSTGELAARGISLYAGMGRSSRSLPQSHPYRLELYLLWGDPTILQWLPGRKYIPDWNLKMVAGDPRDPAVIDVRELAKDVVNRIPILWRLASWM